ncbi:MAG TPA: lipoprotein insertase outer membrane protein LolB [Lysobacter sp.]
MTGRMAWHRLAVVTIAAMLAGCVAQQVRPTLPPELVAAAEARQLARETALRRSTQWSLAGRIAVSTGDKGGSGRIDWVQDGAHYEVALSAPVTRQSWRMTADARGARLEGLDGGPREGPDAALLLREATGWEIPITALTDWVRGLRAEALGAAAAQYDIDGRLAQLEQGGWTIRFAWPEATAADAALPTRLDAQRGAAKVRLIIDQWDRDRAR